MILKKLGQIIGLFSSVSIVFSIFLSYVSVEVMGFSIFSMSLLEYNKKGAIVIAALAFMGFFSVYAYKGTITSVIAIIIFVANIFFCINMSTGIAELDEGMKMVKSLVGDFFSPGVGFLVAAGGSLLLFFSGLMISKSGDSKKESKA